MPEGTPIAMGLRIRQKNRVRRKSMKLRCPATYGVDPLRSSPGLHALRLDNAHRGALGQEFEQSSGSVRRRGVCGDATFKVDVGLDLLRERSYNLDAGRRQQSGDCGHADVSFAPGHEVTDNIHVWPQGLGL